MATWDESQHPREPGGSSKGGQFIDAASAAAAEATDTMNIDRARSIVDRLARRFQLKTPIVEENPHYYKAYAHAHRLGGGIEVNSELINSGWRMSKYNEAYKNTPSPEEIITHEFGHSFEQELMLDGKYLKYGMGRPSAMRAAGMDWDTSLAAALYGIAKNEGALLSDYATTNDSEYFAEAFVHYIRGPEYWKNINPRVLAIFREFDKGVK